MRNLADLPFVAALSFVSFQPVWHVFKPSGDQQLIMDFYKNLSGDQWCALVPFGLACAAVGFSVKTLLDKKCGGGRCNPNIRKGEAKVVNTVDIEDIGNQKAFCRCWKSSKFPYCDGSHNKHNEETGDNVGPLLVQNKNKS